MAKELNEGPIHTQLTWYPVCDINLKDFSKEFGWVLASDGKNLAPAFLGFSLFRRGPRWCSAATSRPLLWEPTHISYPRAPSLSEES